MANFHKDEWFQEQLQRHWNWAEKRLGDNEIIAVLYTGSGNYNCDTAESDCDSWIIYFDKNYDVTTYQVSQEPVYDEVAWICDIRAFIYGLLNGDWMYTIAYFSKYKIINPRYKDLWDEFWAKRERVVYVNRQGATEILKNNARLFYKVIGDTTHTKPYKRLYYIKFIAILYDAYTKHQPIGDCFYNEKYAAELLRLKNQASASREELLAQARDLMAPFINIPPLNNINTKATIATAKQTLALIPRFERRANNG